MARSKTKNKRIRRKSMTDFDRQSSLIQKAKVARQPHSGVAPHRTAWQRVEGARNTCK